MINTLYLFAGTVSALHFYLSASSAADKDAALAANSTLQTVSEQLLAAAADNPSSDFNSLLDPHVVSVIEAIEQLRATQAYQGLDAALTAPVDEIYSIADLLMGGGGCDLDHEHNSYCGVGSSPGFTD